jgi:hypothetical protein
MSKKPIVRDYKSEYNALMGGSWVNFKHDIGSFVHKPFFARKIYLTWFSGFRPAITDSLGPRWLMGGSFLDNENITRLSEGSVSKAKLWALHKGFRVVNIKMHTDNA